MKNQPLHRDILTPSAEGPLQSMNLCERMVPKVLAYIRVPSYLQFTNLDKRLMTRIHHPVYHTEWPHDLKRCNHPTMWTFFFFKIVKTFAYTYMYIYFISVYHVCAYCLLGPEEGMRSPGAAVRRFWGTMWGTQSQTLAGAAMSALTPWAISVACHVNFTCSLGTYRTQELSTLPLTHTARF